MRTREEQIEDLANLFGEEGTFSFVDDRDAATKHILEAERRAEQRVRAEIGHGKIALPTYEAFCNSAKGLMSGEFGILTHIQCYECDGSGIEEENIEDGTDLLCEACAGEGEITVEHLISWGTIKQIYRAIVDEYGPKEAIDAAGEVG